MRSPRQVEIDWLALQRAFERFDPTWDGEPLPYLNVRTGEVAYFGENEDVDLADTLDFDRHVALSLLPHTVTERHARMRAFAAAVPEAELGAELRAALSRKGGVSRFYDILQRHPAVFLRWQRVEAPRVQAIIAGWIRAEMLIVTNPPPWGQPGTGEGDVP